MEFKVNYLHNPNQFLELKLKLIDDTESEKNQNCLTNWLLQQIRMKMQKREVVR